LIKAQVAGAAWIGETSRMENQIARPDSRAIEAALLRLIAEREPGKTVDPAEAARELGGAHPDQWGPLMQPIRRAAVALAEQGRLVILRKGKPVDPRDFKGVYRLTAPRQD
jgi:hypothetical protein